MIDKFKKWVTNNSKPKVVTKPKPNLIDINKFIKETKELLSYLFDNNEFSIEIEKNLYEYKVILKVTQENFDDLQTLHHTINGFITKNFNDIKDDFIPYIQYMRRKYNGIDAYIKINNDETYSTGSFNIDSELDTIPNIKFNSISFYVRK